MKKSVLSITLIAILSSCGMYSGKLSYQRANKTPLLENNEIAQEQDLILPEEENKEWLIVAQVEDELASTEAKEPGDSRMKKFEEHAHGTSRSRSQLDHFTENYKFDKLVFRKSDPVEDQELAQRSLRAGKASFIPVIGWIFAIIAILAGRKVIKRNPKTNEDVRDAKLGVKLGIISTSIGLIILLSIFIMFAIAIFL